MTTPRVLPVLLGMMLITAAPAPGAAQAVRDGCADLLENTDRHIINSSREVRTIRLENRRCRLDVTQRGDARYTPDFRGISSFSPGGQFILEEGGEGPARRLELTDDGRGGVNVVYRVGRNTQPFDAAAEAWFADRLLLLYRRSGLAAAPRAEWLLRTGGIDALLAEAALVRSSTGSAEYLKRAVTAPGLTDAQLVSLLRTALPSSSSGRRDVLSEVLVALTGSRRLSDRAGEAFLEAVAQTSSSSAQRDLLQRMLRGGGVSAPLLVATLRTTENLSSASAKGEVLRSVAADYRLGNDAVLDAYLSVVRGISSSSWQREALGAALAQGDLSTAQLARVLRTSDGIQSGSARGELLIQLAQTRRLEGEARAAYVDAATSISSSSQRARALEALERGPVR